MIQAAVFCDFSTYQNHLFDALTLFRSLHQTADVYFTVFYDTAEFLERHKDGWDFDLYMIDVGRAGGGEHALVQTLLREDPHTGMIFLSTGERTEALPEAVEQGGVLALPCRNEKLFRLIEQKIKAVSPLPKSCVSVDTNTGMRQFRFFDIMYVEYQDRRMIYNLVNGDRILSKTIRTSFGEELDALPSDPHFIRCHSAFYVNMERMVWLSKKDFSTQGGNLIPVSKRRYAVVKAAYAKLPRRCQPLTANINAAIHYCRNYAPQLQYINKMLLPAGVLRVDADQTGAPFNVVLLYANEPFCRRFGREREWLLGTSFFDIVPEKERKEIAQYSKVAYSGEAITLELLLQKGDRNKATLSCFQASYGYCGFIIQSGENHKHGRTSVCRKK